MDKIKQILDKVLTFIYDKKHILLPTVLVLLIFTITFQQIYPTALFVPIDGNYQNYNVVRRLLAGQVPYRDFVVYLGPLHLYLGALLTKIFGNTFVSSVFSFNLLAILTFTTLCVVISKALRHKTSTTLIVTISIILLIDYLSNLNILTPFIKEWITLAFFTHGSARFLRTLILPLACILIMITDKKVTNESSRNLIYGAIAGVAFPCSNDYGCSTCAAICLWVFVSNLLNYKFSKKLFQNLLIFGIGLVLSFVLAVVIFSQGHPVAWFENSAGISSYQAWYYVGDKAAYLYQINIKLLPLLQMVLTGYFVYKYYLLKKQNAEVDRLLTYKILGIINLTACIATQELNYLGDRIFVLPAYILYITLIFLSVNPIKNIIEKCAKNHEKIKIYFTSIVILTAITVSCVTFIHSLESGTKEVKIKELGGRVSQFSKDIVDAKKFVGDKKIFSTYSSALENVTNQFHPTRYDYIIHVLGDKARQDYMDTFRKGDFSYVTIQKPAATFLWENGWIRNANWFFYRELYKNYKPVYTNNYLTIFEKKTEQDYNNMPKNTKIEIKRSKYKSLVKIKTDKNVNGIVDLYIDFDIKNKNLLSKIFCYRKFLKVQYFSSIPFDYIYISKKSPQIIPVSIVNGEGQIELSTLPKSNVRLAIKSIKTDTYYKTPMNFLEIKRPGDDEAPEDETLTVEYTFAGLLQLEKAKYIKINDKRYLVKKVGLNNKGIEIQIENFNKKSLKNAYFVEIMN